MLEMVWLNMEEGDDSRVGSSGRPLPGQMIERANELGERDGVEH